MPWQDHHRLYLDQSIWNKDERTLRPTVRDQIMRQVESRFPSATHVYLAGSLTTNYWNEDSDLDLLIAVPKQSIPKLSHHLATLNSREILTHYSPPKGELKLEYETPISKNHKAYWYLLNNEVPPEIVSAQFGRLYDLTTQRWYGALKPHKAQFTDPKTLKQYINWNLFKHKESTELWPLTWTFAFAGFNEMPDKEKLALIDDLKRRRSRIDRLLTAKLKQHPKVVWKGVEEFEARLADTEDEELAPATITSGNLPKSVVYLVLHKFRYSDIIDRLATMAEEDAEKRLRSELMQGIPIDAATKTTSSGLADNLLKRLDTLVTFILSRSGGANQIESVVTRLFMFVLDTNRYVRTDALRRRIVRNLYNTYIRG